MTGLVYEAVTDLHLSPFHWAAAAWEATGQNQSLVLFLSVSVEETGLSQKLLSFVAFFVEVTDQSLNHACSEPFSLVVTNEDRVKVFYLMTSRAFFWQGTNLPKKNYSLME